MALQMKQFMIRFDPETGGPRSETEVVAFNRRVRKAEAALKGFEAKFSTTDRELHHIHVDIDVLDISNTIVKVRGDFALRDRSGLYDDRYEGFIQGIVIAETD